VKILKIAVVSPHRDDAAFSLALAVGVWIEAGHKVIVINGFSRSQYAPFSEMEFVHSNDRMSFVTALRGREDEVWRRQYGSALTLVDLNMKDAPLRLHCASNEVFGLAVNPLDKSLVKIQKAVERTGAGAVVLPLGLGGHIDHMAARESLTRMATTNTPCAFYEDLPVTEGAAIEESVRDLERELKVQLAPVFARGSADVRAAAARKRRAVLCYDSQIDDAEVERIARFSEQYDGRERLWGNTAWLESELSFNL
jgi:LmbE family N-acetylglucosaminyl deacetylase